MSTRDQYATWSPSPNCWPGRMGYKPRYIVLHGTAGGSNGSSVGWLVNPQSQVSAHYVISQAGQIWQLVDEEAAAWANGVLTAGHAGYWNNDINPNLLSISIEHEKADKYNNTPLTPAQAQASFQLISRICARWNIPARAADANGGIATHGSIDPVNRSGCPGVYPWAALWAYLQQQHGDTPNMLTIGSGIGRYFTDANTTPPRWHCAQTKADIIGAHLDFYRRYEGIFGLPLLNEIYLAQYAGTAIMVYERAVAIYDPNRIVDRPPFTDSCYLLHIDNGIGQQLIAKPLISQLNQQIATLQQNLAAAQQDLAAAQKPDNTEALTQEINRYKQAYQVVISTLQPLS